MACEFEVLLNAHAQPEAAEAAVEALDLVDQLEDQLTVYRDHSEIMKINREAALGDVAVESQLFELLEHAAALHEATSGAFDITAGPLAKAWGFYRRQGRLPTEEELVQALERVGSQHLGLDSDRRTVRFDIPGIEINLGGIGKGYALDRAAEVLLGGDAKNFLLHGGQSSVLARGNRLPTLPSRGRGGDPPTSGTDSGDGSTDEAGANELSGWLVGVTHPLRPRERLGLVRLKDRAMGTSGSGTQFFTHRGKRYGHILDPRTGRPAEGVLSVSVLADRAATADALATALYVMGVAPAVKFLENHQEIAALIVAPGKQRGAIELLTVGLSDDDWEPAG
jgi:thiamine biosynthesis lipoprotein